MDLMMLELKVMFHVILFTASLISCLLLVNTFEKGFFGGLGLDGVIITLAFSLMFFLPLEIVYWVSWWIFIY